MDGFLIIELFFVPSYICLYQEMSIVLLTRILYLFRILFCSPSWSMQKFCMTDSGCKIVGLKLVIRNIHFERTLLYIIAISLLLLKLKLNSEKMYYHTIPGYLFFLVSFVIHCSVMLHVVCYLLEWLKRNVSFW